MLNEKQVYSIIKKAILYYSFPHFVSIKVQSKWRENNSDSLAFRKRDRMIYSMIIV